MVVISMVIIIMILIQLVIVIVLVLVVVIVIVIVIGVWSLGPLVFPRNWPAVYGHLLLHHDVYT